MQEIIQSILSNIAIIFFMHLCLDAIVIQKERLTRFLFSLAMIFTVSATVISIFYLPISYGAYQFDLRLIPLVIFAYKWGWTNGLIALIITSIWRFEMGGAGAVPGITFGMVLPVFLALFWRSITYFKGFSTYFFLISIAWIISDFPIIFFLTDGWLVFKEIALIRFSSFNLTAFILYIFIKNTEREILLKKNLEYLAERDSLTGLYNIRFFKEKVQSYKNTATKKFIVMVDIDHFKTINDTYGHVNGDLIIKSVSSVLTVEASKYKRAEFIIGRYGGEEFIIFIAVELRSELIKIVEELRKKMEEMTFYTKNKTTIRLTVSMGVSEMKENTSLIQVIEEADQSLYKSKNNGRNQITIYQAQ